MGEKESSCVSPAGGPVEPVSGGQNAADGSQLQEEVAGMTARVGQVAPDFEATGYVDGQFKNVKLSDYRGKWVTLCFYPGDFTFV